MSASFAIKKQSQAGNSIISMAEYIVSKGYKASIGSGGVAGDCYMLEYIGSGTLACLKSSQRN